MNALICFIVRLLCLTGIVTTIIKLSPEHGLEISMAVVASLVYLHCAMYEAVHDALDGE